MATGREIGGSANLWEIEVQAICVGQLSEITKPMSSMKHHDQSSPGSMVVMIE